MKKIALLILIAACLAVGGVRADPAPAATDKAAALTTPQIRCEPTVGSRISRKPDAEGNCRSESSLVRTYSQEEIQRTGQTDLGQALQQLDPAISRFR